MGDVVLGAGPLPAADVVAVARDGRVGPARRGGARAHDGDARPRRGDPRCRPGRVRHHDGFGALANVHIAPADVRALQHNLVRSHAAGAGPLLPAEVVRAMTLLRARTLATGHPGVRPELVERMLAMLNAGITPAVPSRGSVGASGDLAPLAHVGLCAIGEGRALTADGTEPAADALGRAGMAPMPLEAKEGLALVNGTEGMLALGMLAAADVATLLRTADVTAAMTIESALGTDRPFAADLMALRPHPGQAASAANLRALLAGERDRRQPRTTATTPCRTRTRCGARPRCTAPRATRRRSRRTSSSASSRAVTDNPVVLADGRVESAGNFHGEPLAYALDLLAIAMTGLANISERRTAWLLAPGRDARAPAVPHRARRAVERVHDRPVHAGGARERVQGPRAPGERRLDPDLGEPGGPREHGLDRRAQAARGPAARRRGPRDRGALRGAGARPAGAARAGRRDRRGARRGARASCAHLDEDREMAPDIAAATTLVAEGVLAAAVAEGGGAGVSREDPGAARDRR